MSIYNFIASNKPLDEFIYGIEVINKNMISIPDENKTLNIFKDTVTPDTQAYTALPCIMGVEISKFPNVKYMLFDYIKSQAKEQKAIELWSTWLDEVETPKKRSVRLDELTIDDLSWVWGREFYNEPRVLKIFRWSK